MRLRLIAGRFLAVAVVAAAVVYAMGMSSTMLPTGFGNPTPDRVIHLQTERSSESTVFLITSVDRPLSPEAVRYSIGHVGSPWTGSLADIRHSPVLPRYVPADPTAASVGVGDRIEIAGRADLFLVGPEAEPLGGTYRYQ